MKSQIPARRFLSEDNFQWLIVICCQLVFIGLISSRALASIGMMALLGSVIVFSDLRQTVQNYLNRKELWILSLFFWIVCISGLWSEDKSAWLTWTRIKLPFIALPLAFAAVPALGGKRFAALLYGFVLIMVVSAVVVLKNYGLHYSEITDSLLRGNAIPIPFPHSHISHIRYTLMLAFAFFCCWYFLESKMYLFSENERWLQGFSLLFCFATLHILSVRSSLLALYAGILLMVFRFIFVQKKFALGAALLLIIIAIPFAAIKVVPSLKNKFDYMRYDYRNFQNGEVQNLSDGIRLVSIKEAVDISKQNLWLGIGAGDLRSEMDKRYTTDYPQLAESDRKLPHSQLIWTLATTGIIGLSLFMLAFGFPLFANGNYKNWLLVMLHLVLFSSFFTEATLEEQIGTGFYLTLLLVLLNQFRNE